MTVLLLKVLLGPALVVASTLAGRRWGDGLAGVLVALPVVAGPILFITYQLHGEEFTAVAAGSSLLGLVSLAVFAVVFAHLGCRFRSLATSLCSWVAVLLSDFALSALLPVSVGVGLLMTLATTCLALALLPAAQQQHQPGSAPRLWVDLTSRAVVTAVLILAITTASGALGPGWTGLLAPFPTALTVVAAFVHAQRGPTATIRTLQGALFGLFGFAGFCAVVAATVRTLGAGAFVAGLVAAVFVQLILTALRSSRGRLPRRPKRPRPRPRSRETP